MPAACSKSLISLFILVPQHYPSFTGQHTFLIILRPNILSAFMSSADVGHASDPQVRMCRVRVPYSFNLVLRNRTKQVLSRMEKVILIPNILRLLRVNIVAVRPVRKADNLTTIVPLSRNLGTSTSWNPLGPSGL
jgi:hypothetical protein